MYIHNNYNQDRQAIETTLFANCTMATCLTCYFVDTYAQNI